MLYLVRSNINDKMMIDYTLKEFILSSWKWNFPGYKQKDLKKNYFINHMGFVLNISLFPFGVS